MSERRGKYNARRMMVDGRAFDSTGEAGRYLQLKALEQDGKISGLECQKVFELLPGFVHQGKKIQPITYRADFVYFENGRQVVEDFKGFETAEFKLKRKMLLFNYPDIDFRVVKG